MEKRKSDKILDPSSEMDRQYQIVMDLLSHVLIQFEGERTQVEPSGRSHVTLMQLALFLGAIRKLVDTIRQGPGYKTVGDLWELIEEYGYNHAQIVPTDIEWLHGVVLGPLSDNPVMPKLETKA